MTKTFTIRAARFQPQLVLGVLLAGAVSAAAAGNPYYTARTGQDASRKPPEATITLSTSPIQPVAGDNIFEVIVTDPDGKPVVGAAVSVLLIMPAMPRMGMPEMRNTVALKPAEGKAAAEGKYVAKGQVPMAGRWNVTVSVKVNGKDFAEKKFTLMAM